MKSSSKWRGYSPTSRVFYPLFQHIKNTNSWILEFQKETKLMRYKSSKIFRITLSSATGFNINLVRMFKYIYISFYNILTHFITLVSFYTPWKHQKTFSDVFRGYRKTPVSCNQLKSLKNEALTEALVHRCSIKTVLGRFCRLTPSEFFCIDEIFVALK